MESWEHWFERLGPALVLYARQWTSSQPDAEDAVQEAFIACFRRRRVVDDPQAYLFTCVRNATRQQRRGSGRRIAREQAVAAENLHSHGLLTAPESHDDAEQLERRNEIERALVGLPDEQREVVVMRIWGELSFPRIAAALAISPNTAASRYRYALAALRRKLHDEQPSRSTNEERR